MKLIKRSLQIFVLSLFIVVTSYAAQPFVIKHIQVQGLQRIAYGTVLNYLPVHVGQTLNPADTSDIIKALYKTGFFSEVSLSQQGNTLIIHVQERPTIGKITITGNKAIQTSSLKSVLKDMGVADGRVYKPSTLDTVQESLQNQYYNRGNYNAQVKITVVPAPRDRVNINIKIAEGATAKIKQIKIIGNHAFSESKLLRQLKLSTPHFWSFITKNDQYSKEKLDADLETLRSYYMDRGYIKFKIDSSQVSITPNKKEVYIVIHITEGPQYFIKGYKLSGKLLYPKQDLRDLINFQEGEVFSRKKLEAANKALANYYGDRGYAFANIRPIPEIDNKNKQVFITFMIDPGSLVYVRRITFTGNSKTEDQVLRREMRQQEASLVSTKDVKESEHRLHMLSYFKDVKVGTKRVPGTDDEVDMNFKVTETPSATLTAGIGYSDDDGILINAGFNQPNFLGTGKSVGVNFDTSDYERSYSVSYFNPYYTKDGIGRGFTLYANSTDSDKVDISTYTTDNYGLNMNFSVPLSETDSASFGIGYERTHIDLGNSASAEINQFVYGNPFGKSPFTKGEGDRFNNVLATVGWGHVGFDRAIFPTKGFAQSVGLEVALPGGGTNNISYYKANYLAHLYQPITHGFILSLRGEVGYGDGLGSTKDLPFYENYFAGGIETQGAVRGYDAYSIGPKDSNGDTLGGNFLVDGSVELIIPTGITPDTLRTTAFVDFGNVYTNVKTSQDSGPVRFSVGVSAHWRSPIGPLVFSLATPINAQRGDDREPFQFNVGTSF